MVNEFKNLLEKMAAELVGNMNRMIEPEDLEDIAPNAITKTSIGYVEAVANAIIDINNIRNQLNQQPLSEVLDSIGSYEISEEDEEIEFQTENVRGTIIVNERNEFDIDNNVIIFNKSGIFNNPLIRRFFPNGQETEFDLNVYDEIENEKFNDLDMVR